MFVTGEIMKQRKSPHTLGNEKILNLLIEYQGEQHEKYIPGFHKSKKDFENADLYRQLLSEKGLI